MSENELDCPIVEVTIYRSEADIKRTGKIHLPAGGLQQVIIPNVSSKINQDSIRVNGRGFGSIISTDIKSKLGERTKNPEIIALLDALEQLNLDKARLEAEKTAIEQQQEGLLSLWNKTTHEEHFLRRWAMGKVTLETLKTLESYVFQPDFSTKLLDLDKKLKKLQEKIDDKTEQLEMLNARERESVERLYDVVINVEVEQESDFEFDITYRIYDSYWHPTYDFTLESESESAKVEQFVLVRNSTFEPWNNAYLTLSTVSTSITSIQEPEPYYLYLGTPYVAKPRSVARRDMFEAEKKMADMEVMDDLVGAPYEEEPALMPPPAPDLKVVEAELRSEGEVQVFKLPEKVTIPPDGEPHGFLAQTYKLQFKREFYWDAYLGNEVIELLKITNGDVTLLPGRTKVFEGSDFIGATDLPKIAPSEEFDAGARVSPTIKAEKKLMEHEAEKAGLVGKKSTRYYKYLLKIENLREQNSLITVYDRIPKSQSEEVEVEIKSMKPEPKEKRLGIHKWEVEVLAKSEFIIEYDFVIEFPRGQNVYPLP